MYLLRISGPLTEMKLSPHSFATADASSVFPHPGNPYNNNLNNGPFVSGPPQRRRETGESEGEEWKRMIPSDVPRS